MQTTSDKWYPTKLLSALLIVLLFMIFIMNQSFTSQISAVSIPFDNGPEIIEPMTEVTIHQEKPKIKLVQKKKTETEIVKVVPDKVDIEPVIEEKDIPIDTSLLVDYEIDSSADNGAVTALVEPAPTVKTPVKKPEPAKPLPWSEKMPEYPGGKNEMNRFLNRKMNYPSFEQEIGLEGLVVVGFVVSKTGVISEVEILKSPSEGFTKEAMTVIAKMPEWTPGYHNGEAVDVRYTLPIRFKLN